MSDIRGNVIQRTQHAERSTQKKLQAWTKKMIVIPDITRMV
jgi:hypothetical protein